MAKPKKQSAQAVVEEATGQLRGLALAMENEVESGICHRHEARLISAHAVTLREIADAMVKALAENDPAGLQHVWRWAKKLTAVLVVGAIQTGMSVAASELLLQGDSANECVAAVMQYLDEHEHEINTWVPGETDTGWAGSSGIGAWPTPDGDDYMGSSGAGEVEPVGANAGMEVTEGPAGPTGPPPAGPYRGPGPNGPAAPGPTAPSGGYQPGPTGPLSGGPGAPQIIQGQPASLNLEAVPGKITQGIPPPENASVDGTATPETVRLQAIIPPVAATGDADDAATAEDATGAFDITLTNSRERPAPRR